MLTLEMAYLMYSMGHTDTLAQCGRELLQAVNIRKHSSLGGHLGGYDAEFVFYSRRFRVVA